MNIQDFIAHPFTKLDKDWALLTAGIQGDFNSMTISWGGMGTMWHKPVLFLVVKPTRYTYEFVTRHEEITVSFYDAAYKKALGVLMGCSGALMLILTSAAHVSDKVGDIRGDLLCLFAQFSFALYLSLFNKLIRRYNVFTTNKWMFLWASLMVIPFSAHHVICDIDWPQVPIKTWLEAGYVVFFGTYVGYILTMIGQKTLRPTVVSVYNYVQPLVSVTVSLLTGIGVFTWPQGIAVILVFSGVWLVTKSKSRRDMEKKAEIP